MVKRTLRHYQEGSGPSGGLETRGLRCHQRGSGPTRKTQKLMELRTPPARLRQYQGGSDTTRAAQAPPGAAIGDQTPVGWLRHHQGVLRHQGTISTSRGRSGPGSGVDAK